jgi:hypothetical protein
MAGCFDNVSALLAPEINGDFKLKLEQEMSNLGVPTSIAQAYLNGLSDVVSESDISEAIDEEKIRESITSKTRQLKKLEASSVKEDLDYDPQNKLEGFEIEEVVIESKVKTVDQKPIEYRPYKKQHFVKTVIDKMANLYQTSKKLFNLEFLHYKSKSYLKIDKDGNVTIYVKGNLKHVVEGDYALEVRGSKAFNTLGDSFDTVEGDVNFLYNKNWNIDVTKKTTLTSNSGILFNNDLKVDANVNITGNLDTDGNTTTIGNNITQGNLVGSSNLTVSGTTTLLMTLINGIPQKAD